MNILHWLFNKLYPEVGTNWLSVKCALWRYSKRDKHNLEYLKNPHVPIKIFKVAGAGDIVISNTPTHMTARNYGFHISISWSEGGLGCGGVLGLEEARAMAEHILAECNKQVKSEKELVEEKYQLMFPWTNYKPIEAIK